MRILLTVVCSLSIVAGFAGAAWAGAAAPEIDAGSAGNAIALLLGGGLLIVERRRRQR